MSHVFISIYNFFSKRRILFTCIVSSIFLLSLFFASKIKLEEDITKFIPKSAEIDKFNYVLQNFNLKDKLILSVHYKNDNPNNSPDSLQKYVDEFADLLYNHCKNHIKELQFHVTGDDISTLLNEFYDNLPLYLNENDYKKIDSLIEKKKINQIMHTNYLMLQSPASTTLKKMIVNDPVGLTYMALNKLNNFRIEENFDLYNDYLVSKDKKSFLLFITSAYPSNETNRNTDLIKGIDQSIKSLTENKSGIEVNYYGSIAVGVSNATQLKSDTILTVVVAVIFIFFFISFFFRRKTVPFIIILPVIFGITFSLALLFLIKTHVSLIALGAGSIIFGIAVNYSLHIFAHARHTESVTDVIKELTFPLTLGSFTTIGAFICLLFVKSEALRDFGLFSAFSLIGAVLFSLIVLPHFIKPNNNQYETKTDWLTRTIEKISNYHPENNKYIIISILLLTLVFLFFMRKVKFDSNLSNVNYQNKSLKKSENFFNSNLNSSEQSIYLISTGKDLQEAMKINEKLKNELKSIHDQSKDFRFMSASDLLISDSVQRCKIQVWNNYWTENKKQKLKSLIKESSTAYKFKEDAFDPFYKLLDKKFDIIDTRVFLNKNRFILENWVTSSPEMTMIATVLKIKSENADFIYSKFPDSGDVVVFDKKKLATRFINAISSDFNLILTLSSILVFVSLLITYGRIELALITFIPMLISWIWILGLMGILGIKFNIINIIISTFIFGLGDDFSIFIMDGLTQEYKKGIKVLPYYKTSIFLSDITMIVGIGVLIFAGHPALKSIAMITVIGLLSVLVISTTIEPVLFKIMIGNRKLKGWPPVTFTNILTSVFVYSAFILACIFGTCVGLLILPVLPIRSRYKKYIFHWMMRYLCSALFLVMFNVKKKKINHNHEDLKKPAVIICNHQSHIDIPLLITMKTKLVILTNDWVQKNIFYGWIVKYADFYPVSSGIENSIEFLSEKVKLGYSILVFPEGTRSETGKIRRFHNGAAFIAEKLEIDILPVLLHGTGDCMTKKDDLVIKNGQITVKFLDRIPFQNQIYDMDIKQQTKFLQNYFREEYLKLRNELETPVYFRNKLIKNYIYKGPVLEWYVKTKLLLENNYRVFNDLIPKNAVICDLGCGFGYIPYLLSMCSENRRICAIDYDEEKITLAENCFSKNQNIRFIKADIAEYELQNSDVFLISDMLHYLPDSLQKKVLNKCLDKLNQNGMIIIRDGDKQNKSGQILTKYTEFFSTNTGFNLKMHGKLSYFSKQELGSYLPENQVEIKVIEKSRFSSNSIYLITRKLTDYASV